MRYTKNIRKGYMPNNPRDQRPTALVKPQWTPYFPPEDVPVDCVVCGNTYPRNTMSEEHNYKVCRFDARHVHPDNVYRYQRGGKHNKYN